METEGKLLELTAPTWKIFLPISKTCEEGSCRGSEKKIQDPEMQKLINELTKMVWFLSRGCLSTNRYLQVSF